MSALEADVYDDYIQRDLTHKIAEELKPIAKLTKRQVSNEFHTTEYRLTVTVINDDQIFKDHLQQLLDESYNRGVKHGLGLKNPVINNEEDEN